MHIANNILKHYLKNVYFLTGTALAGKTTMSRTLAQKHGFILFNDNYHEGSFRVFRSICNEKYQPQSTRKKETTDWEAFFGRSVAEFLAVNQHSERSEGEEYNEFVILELITLAQKGKVIADVGISAALLREISDYSRIACLLATPELVTCENYGKREDRRTVNFCLTNSSVMRYTTTQSMQRQ